MCMGYNEAAGDMRALHVWAASLAAEKGVGIIKTPFL